MWAVDTLDIGGGPILHTDIEANARLIASAPELLEALINLLETCEYGDSNADEYNAAAKAIAKAKGDAS